MTAQRWWRGVRESRDPFDLARHERRGLIGTGAAIALAIMGGASAGSQIYATKKSGDINEQSIAAQKESEQKQLDTEKQLAEEQMQLSRERYQAYTDAWRPYWQAGGQIFQSLLGLAQNAGGKAPNPASFAPPPPSGAAPAGAGPAAAPAASTATSVPISLYQLAQRAAQQQAPSNRVMAPTMAPQPQQSSVAPQQSPIPGLSLAQLAMMGMGGRGPWTGPTGPNAVLA